ncbi:DUF6445 family protein [Parvularcula marina]|uniref:Uncharacterized protein n=1 Tax=Parvularcula marina TaxID=2292771 RepID=A0A371RFS4_9PROT|nr:DUF6445 family protein [Parvularcula marina]RFB04302.1 hypothetical protein DX908_02800 [Parvularcula marina]
MSQGAPRAEINHELIGDERLPVLIIDNALSGAERLIDLAAQSDWSVRSQYYPGIRAAAPMDYATALSRALEKPIFEAFGWNGGSLTAEETSFSLVTTPPEQLVPYQRVPHIDGTDICTLAVLHFIGRQDDEETGTSFFRHGRTGFESVNAERHEAYRAATEQDLAEDGEPPEGYIQGSTQRYEQTAFFAGRYNRILVYQGHTLHCGMIPPGFSFNPDPREGRLTVNTFLKYRP